MSDHNNGGPAFPNPALVDENYKPQPGDGGMSLRDWFAGQALAGLLTRGDVVGTEAGLKHVKGALAGLAFAYADAMLTARNPTPNKGA